jgi:aspartate-semialdehyde dehydrogenase
VSAEEGLRVAVIGASGALGSELLAVLDERRFPLADVVPVATDRSLGGEVELGGETYPILTEVPRLEAVDLLFLCAPPVASLDFAKAALRDRVPCFDLSGALVRQPDVPLLAADLGYAAEDLAKPLVATPAGAALALGLVLAPLEREAGLRRVVVTSLEAVSGAGQQGMESLSQQVLAIFNQQSPPPSLVFDRSVAFDVLPAVGEIEATGSTAHEEALVCGLRRLLGRPDLPVAATVLRVPTFTGDGASLAMETEAALTAAQAREILAKAPGVALAEDDPRGPTTRSCAGSEHVRVGRLRPDPTSAHGLLLWTAADAVRLAASNAVRLAEARFLAR